MNDIGTEAGEDEPKNKGPLDFSSGPFDDATSAVTSAR